MTLTKILEPPQIRRVENTHTQIKIGCKRDLLGSFSDIPSTLMIIPK